MSGVRPFTDAEIKSVMRALKGTRDKALFQLGARTGLRIMEMLSIKVGDVGERITVTAKGGERHTVLVHPDVLKLLRRHIRESELEAHHFLFRSREGGNRPIDRSHAWRIFRSAASKCSGRIGCHSLRKYFAAKMYHHFGRDLVPTAQALRHKSLENTRAYLQFELTSAVESAVKRIKWA